MLVRSADAQRCAGRRRSYDLPLRLFLVAALLSLLVTEYLLLSVRELRALIFEPVLFFWLLYTLRGSTPLALGGFLVGATLTALAAIAPGAARLRRHASRRRAARPGLVSVGQPPGVDARPSLAVSASPAAWPGGAGCGCQRRCVGLALVLTFSTGGWLGALAGVLVVVAALGRRGLAAALRRRGGAGAGRWSAGWRSLASCPNG